MKLPRLPITVVTRTGRRVSASGILPSDWWTEHRCKIGCGAAEVACNAGCDAMTAGAGATACYLGCNVASGACYASC
jgi:hypothetical protein